MPDPHPPTARAQAHAAELERQRAAVPERLILIACSGQVEDLLAAAIRTEDPRYLDGHVGQLRVLSSTPMPR